MLQPLTLELLKSYDSRLIRVSGFTVLPESGRAVMLGEASTKDPHTIHIWQRVDGGQLKWLREVKAPCRHEMMGVLGVVVEGRELLAVACKDCEVVKFMDLESGKVFAEFEYGEEKPWKLCAGEPGKLWVWMVGGEVIELDCSTLRPTPTGRKVSVNLPHCDDFCFIPAPHDVLIAVHHKIHTCFCVSCDSDKEKWEQKGQVDTKKIWPWGVTFCPRHQVVLMGDHKNNRILVLDPSSGSHLQTLPLPDEVGSPYDVRLYGDQLFMISHCRDPDFHKVSCFSV